MLKTERVRGPQDKRAVFLCFEPGQKTWIVSDLQSKWHLQKDLLARFGVLQESSVLRATELWKQLAFQLRPEIHFLSRELAQILFWDWVEPLKLPWARSPQAIPVLLTQMQAWMGIFSDPSHEEIMAQWFQDHPESYVRWGHWFELGAMVWNQCRERGLVMEAWLPSLILSGDMSRLRWSQPLVFDLGPQISPVEGLLVRELAKITDVEILVPQVPWIHLMKNALKPYEDILEERFQGDTAWRPEVAREIEFGRFSTQLAEVKDAVARVRGWLDEGIDPQQIAFVAPDIEDYWPALRLYLREEGIAACKPVTARLGGFVEMAQWMAGLRTSLSKVSSPDLEVYFYSSQESPRLAFEDFRVLFSNVYDALDMNRARELFAMMKSSPPREAHAVQDFLLWALASWNGAADTARLMALLQVLGREVPKGMKLFAHQWVSYLEGLLARREIPLQPASENGVWCVSLSSADWLEVSHGIFLNLAEGALRQVETSPVSGSEAQKILNDTGYALGTTDRQELEFESLWFLQRPWQQLRLNFSGTDFQGGVMTPSRLWMWAGFTNGKLKEHPETPRATRWDEIQHQAIAELAPLRGMAEAQVHGLRTGLSRDLTIEVNTWRPSAQEDVSASSLEKYQKCPFIFAAERKLKLADNPTLDLDLDRRTRGNLLHAVVEELLLEPLNFDRGEDELAELIDRVREKQEIQVGDERLWPAIRAQHVRLGRLFNEFEKAWRELHPDTRTLGRETDFACYWDLDAAQPTCEKSPVSLRGRLDRVDADPQGRYALIDYKAGAASATNWQSWLKNHNFQLALYAMLLEAGLGGIEKGEVVAANYYIVKDSSRRKGFHLQGTDSGLFPTGEKHRNFISADDKIAFFNSIREKLQQTIKDIMSGRLNPQPEKLSICDECSWRTLCRAPHLN